MTENQKFQDYLNMLRKPFQKLCRLRFLQPDGSTAFMLDNNPTNPRCSAFIADGTITANWQNGRRRSATVTLDNVDGQFDYNVNQVWFGTEIALDEGLVLSDGTEYYIQQGVFLIDSPEETIQPVARTITYNLVDKIANLDGTLLGNLEGTYEVQRGTNIFDPIVALLAEDRGNGQPIDRVAPIFTEYYNGKTQVLTDGTTVNLTDSPYTLTVDAGQTKWDVISGLCAMVNAWVGYDETGALRVDPSQDDILDADKPILWDFSMSETTLLGLSYSILNEKVYNDLIVCGELLDDYSQPIARATVQDPLSPVNVQTIGLKTKREVKAGFGSNKQCEDYAVWTLKRAAALQRAVTISSTQIFHIHGNDVCTVARSDKGGVIEKHLIQSFSRPLAYNGPMTLSCVSVNDFPVITYGWLYPGETLYPSETLYPKSSVS